MAVLFQRRGDIGKIDEDGYVFITDRKKDLIVTAGGKNIAPQPIEISYSANKYVSQAVVIGDQRKFLSVLIVPNFETLAETARSKGIGHVGPGDLARHPEILRLFEEVVTGLNRTLAGFSQIRRFTLLEEEFTQDGGELTPTMKVKRFAINRKYKDVIDAMYPEDLPVDED